MNRKSDTRKKIKVLLNDAERRIVEEKMKKYGYKTIASYVRDASIYENVTVYDLEGKTEVAQELSRVAESVRIFSDRLDLVLLRQDIDEEAVQCIEWYADAVTFLQKQLEKLVEERLWNTKTIVTRERKSHAVR